VTSGVLLINPDWNGFIGLKAIHKWDISTAPERFEFDGPIERIDSMEYKILEEFKRAAKHHLSPKYMPTTLVEWLGLIQHYG
jgi:hypothetical protein